MSGATGSLKKVYFYTYYERFWHWLQAAAMLLLILTGFEISYPQLLPEAGYPAAVNMHNALGVLLSINAFLGFFYNLSSGLIQRYIPQAGDFFTLGFKHARYYLFGIFSGADHPFEKTPEKRLLPLQKVTYFMILNVLLPLMIFTGILKMSAMIDPVLVERFGGLKVLGPLHRFGAWLFTSFVILHVYMTTTGRTPFSSLVAMITGYEYEDALHKESNNE